MNRILVLLTFIVGGTAFANNCPNCQGKAKKAVDICFVEEDFSESIVWRASAQAACGYWSEKFYVDGQEDVRKKMNELKNNCQTIDGMIFYGHGSRGSQSSTGLSTSRTNMWRQYSCLLKENAEVEIMGCNVGRGCEGDMFLHSMAENIFSSNKGSIKAPTFYASSFLPGVVPHFSLDGKSRKLKFDPSKKPPGDWTQTGLAISDGGTMAEHCKSEITELVDDVNSARKNSERRNCESSTFYLGERRLTEFQTLANGLSDNQSWDYSKVERAIIRLSYQLESLKECKPAPREKLKKSGSSTVAQ